MGYPVGGAPVEYEAAQAPGAPYAPQAQQPLDGTGWPANELEQVLTAALGDPGATARVFEVLARSQVWVPLPSGGAPESGALDLPTIELAGAPYVPVFSSEEQFRRTAGNIGYAVAPMWELARGLPLGVGIAVNPEAPVGIPVPPEGVGELCRGPREDRWSAVPSAAPGARVGLREPEPYEEPVEFLMAAASELAALPVVLSARRALATVEGDAPLLFVGVELDSWTEQDKAVASEALGRALGAVPLPWQVRIVLLDVAQDPVGDWMVQRVAPFYTRA
ncbi:enhanced serine sensitivity protein SseB C-terminal domain-containing protein [Streptomyces sp. NPDC092296]|uniref:enhanced serine sensitivity protein SseB C-terminal domain-containing protein n=1 Tax=Streptomyces sp. NPDC092296 TaxID=3366012 RepID=UPI0038078D06